MEQIGKVLVVSGLAIAAIGGLIWLGLLKWIRFGRLPGDISIQRDGFSFYFPITTMILLSTLISGIAWLVGALRK